MKYTTELITITIDGKTTNTLQTLIECNCGNKWWKHQHLIDTCPKCKTRHIYRPILKTLLTHTITITLGSITGTLLFKWLQ